MDFLKTRPLITRHLVTMKNLALGLILVCLVFALYGRMLSASFISFDDAVYVVDNPVINQGFTVKGLWAILDFRQNSGPYWHPVTSLSHMADCTIFGLNPGRHHLVNLLIHGANGVILYLFLFLFTGKRWKSVWVSAMFALHPLNVETVAWISERKNLLATLFFLLGLFAYARFLRRRTCWNYSLLILVFLAGLMSKPTMMTFPFTLFLMLLWPMGGYDFSGQSLGFFTKNRNTLLPILALISGMLILFFMVVYLGGANRNVAPLSYIPLDLRLSNMLIADLVYLVKLVVPVNLSVFHPYPQEIPLGHTLGALAGLGGVSILALVYARKLPFLFVGWFWYVGNLVTASGLMQQGYFPAYADRFTYLPMIGLFMALAWGIPCLFETLKLNRLLAPIAGSLVLVAFSGLTFVQTSYWKNAITLFSHAVAVNPNDALSMTNLALAFGEAGRLDDAMNASYQALALEPDYAEALNNLGTLYAKKGDIKKSLQFFNRALVVYPDFKQAKTNRDMGLKLLESYSAREVALRAALEADPDSLDLASDLAGVLTRENKFGEAESIYRALLENHPQAGVSITYNLACLHARVGNHDKALEWLESSLKKGFRAWDHLDQDVDLSELRTGDDYKALVRRFRPEE
ncbi:MAG: tetratricopeptide repeat protein [Proteobacteria bacterium]|nr:tetratricopeptide repeat protein [Pseudomonadota bacterium]